MASDTFLEVPPGRLVCRPQVRKAFDPAVLAAMAQTMRQLGVQLPVRVRRDGENLVVVDGEMRVRAAALAGLATVPVVVLPGTPDEAEVLLRQLVANVHRSELKPVERAEGVRQLIAATGWTAAEAADHLGLSAASVSRSLALLGLPEAIRRQVDQGTLAASAAYELAQVADPAAQAELAAQLAAGVITRDGARGRRRAPATPATPAARPPGRVTAVLDGGRSLTLTGPCDGIEGLIAALERLLAKARKARPQALSLPTFLQMLKDEARAAVPISPPASEPTNP